MNAQTVRNILKNAVAHQGGTVVKKGSVWCVSNVYGVEEIIGTLFNALPVDYKIVRGVNQSGYIWVQVHGSLKADFCVISINFDKKEVE